MPEDVEEASSLKLVDVAGSPPVCCAHYTPCFRSLGRPPVRVWIRSVVAFNTDAGAPGDIRRATWNGPDAGDVHGAAVEETCKERLRLVRPCNNARGRLTAGVVLLSAEELAALWHRITR